MMSDMTDEKIFEDWFYAHYEQFGPATAKEKEMARKAWEHGALLSRQAEDVEPFAWMREWEGDVSDEGHYLFETDKSELDDNPNWAPLYLHPPKQEASLPTANEVWATWIHYPQCWDTAAYLTINDAISEILACHGCTKHSSSEPSKQEAASSAASENDPGQYYGCPMCGRNYSAASAVPAGWKLEVKDFDGRPCLILEGPKGGAVLEPHSPKSIACEVLREFGADMLAAAPSPTSATTDDPTARGHG